MSACQQQRSAAILPAFDDVDQHGAALLLCHCVLDGQARDGALLELRLLRGGQVEQEWFGDAREAVAYARRRARSWNVYLGCLPRYEHSGGREALRDGARFVWADADSAAAAGALRRFPVKPSFVVYSGGLDAGTPKMHAWWLLRQRVTLEAVEALNRRLVVALGSDTKVCDTPRVLRLPATLNHKTSPPARVLCAFVGDDVDVHELAAALPAQPRPAARRTPTPLRVASALDTIPPAEYVERLTGREAGRDSKVTCPFHAGGQERTPSLHCYADPADGWACYGCPAPPGREALGGDVYTFAGLLWGLDPRTEFVELRQRLERALGVEPLVAGWVR